MSWRTGFDLQIRPYLLQGPCLAAGTYLREFLETIVPEHIAAPSVFGDLETMDAAWHYRSEAENISVEISLYPDGSGDIYVWDQRHTKSMMGELDDPVYINLARKHLAHIARCQAL